MGRVTGAAHVRANRVRARLDAADCTCGCGRAACCDVRACACTATTVCRCLIEGKPDPPDVLDIQKCLEALAALRHAKWFQVGMIYYLLAHFTALCRVSTLGGRFSRPREMFLQS